MHETTEDLTSKLTFFYKFVFPAVWIGIFGLSTLVMFVAPDLFGSSGDLRQMRGLFLAVLLLGTGLIYWACMRIKRVHLAGHEFVISNFRRTIRVPLRDVERVSSSVLMNPELVWLHFRRPTEFGSRVVFMPKQRFFGGYTRHPLAKRLNELLVGPSAVA